MKRSDLIINPDGSIYHLKIRPEELPDLIFVVGDPGRVAHVSGKFDSIDVRRQNREFVSHTGTLNGIRLMVLGTGIGPDNMDIVMNELDALANIDFNTRTIKDEKRSLTIIRLGTSGTFHADIPLGSLALASHGLGLDGSLHYYASLPDVTDHALTAAFIEHAGWPVHLPGPYIIEGTKEIIGQLDHEVYKGIVATAGGFYGPQGRDLRLRSSVANLPAILAGFSHNGLRILNFEMETSSLYGLGRMLGHRVASLCVILANRVTGEYTGDVEGDVQRLISFALEQMTGKACS